MSKKRRDLSVEEKKLWRRVAASVKPRRPAGLDEPVDDEAPPIRATRAKNAAAAPSAPPARAKAKSVAKVAPVANRGTEKNVRRGKIEIAATLDLHGYTQDNAIAALATFLSTAQRRGARAVLVITGAGRLGEGVLRRRLPDWLALGELKPIVAGYAQAHRGHGGAGAFYVFLKRP